MVFSYKCIQKPLFHMFATSRQMCYNMTSNLIIYSIDYISIIPKVTLARSVCNLFLSSLQTTDKLSKSID